MTTFKCFVLTVAAAVLFAACPAPDGNTTANTEDTNSDAPATTAAAPTKDALMTLERSAYEAWKSKDAEFWNDFLSDDFVGYGQAGKLDKASASKEYAGADCDVKSYEISDDSMTPLGNDAAFITYKVAVDATCAGQKLPASSWAVGIYVRDGDKWKGAFHAEAPVADPNAPPKPASSAPAAESKDAEKEADAATEALFAVEKKAWEDWKAGNAEGLEQFAGKNMTSLSPADGWTARDVTLKRWMEPCDIKSVSLSEPASVSFGSDYALLTFNSSVDGKCGDQDVPEERGATIYAKEDGAWKAIMTFGTPKN
ncbi:MAG: nuclear transport factor 2 family protein [Acidobacteria bacterium]|nr:MAG: nuclear transport factor 2 family protein [Acidobacteriota bacterium]REK02779.1 MAG: nuclear transport factor 2 family protein [Acidobacteriota bacterium]REK13416.1 MAG: nuclear transport factor 2 family protein [Acidobacteriota bacterium]REK41410.1 MAG: nuclear transport factor 2 family protein [Acidobacteriota bacterium]